VIKKDEDIHHSTDVCPNTVNNCQVRIDEKFKTKITM